MKEIVSNPDLVAYCGLYCRAFLWRRLNSANPDAFKNGAEKMGIECIIIKDGDEILV